MGILIICYFICWQADVEISFDVNEFGKGEVLDQWVDPQILCSRKGAAVKGGLGPFGLLVFASRGLQEYTAVFFRIFRYQNKNLVLMCSDQSRFVLVFCPFRYTFFFNQIKLWLLVKLADICKLNVIL